MNNTSFTEENLRPSTAKSSERNPSVKPRLLAYMGNTDWMDARTEHTAIPDGMNIKIEWKRWRKWYDGTYCPLLHTEKPADYISFLGWIKREGARRATEIEDFWEA